MVTACHFTNWADLITACNVYATLSGWRFVKSEFMNLEAPQVSREMHQARLDAMPMVLDFADRVGEASADSELIAEFIHCQKIVATAAVFNSMVATCKALALPGFDEDTCVKSADNSDDDADCSYQDVSQPLEVIADRILNYLSLLDANEELRSVRNARLMQASFITEFGLEHNLPEYRDTTAEGILTEFLQRVAEWGGRDAASEDIVRSMVLEEIPRGQRSLRNAALKWFDENRRTAMIGGMLLGGAVGVALAGAAVIVARGRR